MVDKENNIVIYVEVVKNFVDCLLSFLCKDNTYKIENKYN